jgi:AAA domain
MVIKAVPVTLPTRLSVPIDNLQDVTQCWYGREKVGKTSLGAEFKDAIFLMCEPGGKFLPMYRVEVHDWYQFKGAVAELAKDKRFKTVIVDTVDRAYDFCQDAVCKDLAIDHPSDEEWGKGWGRVRAEFSDTMTKLLKLGKGVIFTSHAQEREIRRRGGGSTTRIAPTMAAGARSVLEPMVDCWFFMEYGEDKQREMVLRGDDVIAAGHRLQDHFVGLERINLGRSPKEAFEKFMAAYNNKATQQKGGIPGKKKISLRRSK